MAAFGIRWPLLLAIALAFFGVPALGGPTSSDQVLPLTFYGTRPAVEVMVNGRGPFLFLIDSGAGGPPARADTTLVTALGLSLNGRTTTSDAGGASAAIDRVTFDNVTLGSWSQRSVGALSRNYNGSDYLPHIDGILGFAFFKDVLLTIDYRNKRVLIGSGELPPADGKTILDYELVDGNPTIEISIGGRPERALVDTGDIRAIDIPTAWVRRMHLASFSQLAGSSSSVSGTTQIREVRLADPLLIGEHRMEQPAVTFADDFEVANLGSTLLQNFVVTFDQRNHRVRLVRPS